MAFFKLQPNRTIHLRGFDRRGAAAALHHATETGFKVSGVFRDAADFAVIVLYDADNFFEHHTLRYLPDFDFSGLTLQFDLRYEGLQPIDSRYYPSIDWPYLDVIRADGQNTRVRLSHYATPVGAPPAAASATFQVKADGIQHYDRVTLWFQNYAWDYLVYPDRPLPTAAEIATELAQQINSTNWQSNLFTLSAVATGDQIVVTCNQPGSDGNRLSLYQLNKNANLSLAPLSQHLTGGSSDVTWRITLPFDTLVNADGTPPLAGTQIRQLILTLAPPLTIGQAFSDTEFLAEFSNWQVTGPDQRRNLQVAGPGSVRVDSRDAWVTYKGSWDVESGWYMNGFARHSKTQGDSVTITYHCQHTHDLYLGTSLYRDRASVAVSVDGDVTTTLDCWLKTDSAVNTRRLLRQSLPSGKHTVTITLNAPSTDPDNHTIIRQHFYFDFIEAAVTAAPEPAAQTYPGVMPATDFGTDHTYKMSPQRLVWHLHSLGFRGDLDHYISVFWWHQRHRIGAVFPTQTITIGEGWIVGDQITLNISGTPVGKTIFPADTPDTIAQHFAFFINAVFVGVWAQAAGPVLTVRNVSPVDLYTFDLTVKTEGPTSGSTSPGVITSAGSLNSSTAVEGIWKADPAINPVLNRAARDWHADLFRELAAYGLTCTPAVSMEIVNPPDGWAAEFPNQHPVQTDVGFAGLNSAHCAFIPVVADYQARALTCLADLQQQAGIPIWLQCGEFLWWFFNFYFDNGKQTPGMALYHPQIKADAELALGRPLATFLTPDDDPSVNDYADANWLRSRLKSHIDAIRSQVLAQHPDAKFELLFPNDVTFGEVTPIAQVGGRLNQYINFPFEYRQKDGSGLDRIKVEALAFGATERNLDWAKQSIRLPFTPPNAWSPEDCAYLLPWFNGGCPWTLEYKAARNERLPLVCMWAYDHLCLFSWPLPLPVNGSSAQLL